MQAAVNQTNDVISPEEARLVNLDEWNLMNILDFLEFDDLLALSDISPTFQRIISDHYMVHKFRLHEQVINIHSNNRSNIFYNDFILIGNLASAKLLLRHFGQFVTKLVFNSETEGNEDIRRHVEQHCSENLSELELMKPSGFYLSNYTHRSFINLKKLSFSYPQQIDISPAISQIYPALEELSIGLYVQHKRNEYTEFIRKLLQSTPHLGALSINELPTYNAFRFINDSHPNLEALTIAYDLNIFQNLYDDQMVHFNNVKKLSVEILNSNEIAGRIEFPAMFDQLQILEIRMKHFSQIPFNIIEQSVKLKALAMPKWHEMADLIHILNNVSLTHSIEDIAVVWSSKGAMRSDYTINLLADYPKLRNIRFTVIDVDESMVERDALMAMIPIEWKIIKVERNHEAAFQSFVTITQRIEPKLTINR